MVSRGRDVDGFEKAVAFSAGRWTIEGNPGDVRQTKERQQVLDILARAKGPLSASAVAAETGQSSDAARKMLDRLVITGDVTRSGAWYAPAPEQDDIPF
jgi:hypothetical protein